MQIKKFYIMTKNYFFLIFPLAILQAGCKSSPSEYDKCLEGANSKARMFAGYTMMQGQTDSEQIAYERKKTFEQWYEVFVRDECVKLKK